MACPNNHDIAIDEWSRGSSRSTGPGAHARVSRPGHPDGGRSRLVVPDERRACPRARSRPGPRPTCRLLHPADRLAGRERRFLDHCPVASAAGGGPADAALRGARTGARALQEPVRPGAQLQREVRGRGLLHRAATRRGGDRHLAGTVRGVHARGALPGLQGRPAQADLAGGDRRRQEHRRARRCRSTRRPTSSAGSN